MEKIRMRTASQHRKNDHNNIIGTLNVASFPIHEQQNTEEKKEESKHQFKSLVARKLSIGKPGISLFGLNINPLPSSPEG